MGQSKSAAKQSPDATAKTKQAPIVTKLKIVLLGEQLVGKTPLLDRLTVDDYVFKHTDRITVGADFAHKTLRLSEHRTVQMEVWETSGLSLEVDRLGALPLALSKVDGCLLVCDVTTRESLDVLPAWREKLDFYSKRPDGSTVPCLLLANKIDLTKRRVVQADSLQEVSTRCSCVGWREVSLKDDLGVKDAIQFFLRLLLKEKGAISEDEELDIG